jgi:Zn-dependent protease with chaperone function
MTGFALVFVLLVVALSAIGAGVVALAGPGLRRRGPHAERRAVEVAALAPVLLGLAMVTALVAQSYLGEDHCMRHDHHAHLCVAHGDDWARRPSVVAIIAAAAAVFATRLALVGGRLLRAARSIARLRAVSELTGDVRLVDSPRAFCFVAGLRAPAIYASTAVWRGLSDDERDAMIAHERSHLAHGDVRGRLGLDVLLAFAAPALGAPLARRWAHATERLRDADAARAMGDSDPVARAMVRLCRLQHATPLEGVGFGDQGVLLAERVEALLAGEPTGDRAARFLSIASVAALGALAALAAGLAEPLHHLLETLLG